MYRFLLTPRWLGYAAVAVAMAVIMVLLGNWQLQRYRLHSQMNARIDAAATAAPVPVGKVAEPGRRPPDSVAWTRVTATGRYDGTRQILARDRSVNGKVGFEVLTPLVLPDGTAVLVDRGWIPPQPGQARVRAVPPEAPSGTVTVTGRLRLPESGRTEVRTVDGQQQVRRISPIALDGRVPQPLLGGYLLLDEQRPEAEPALVRVPSDRANSWQNAGYAAQWWLFAGMTLVGYGWLARRQSRGGRPDAPRDRAYDPDTPYPDGMRDPPLAAAHPHREGPQPAG